MNVLTRATGIVFAAAALTAIVAPQAGAASVDPTATSAGSPAAVTRALDWHDRCDDGAGFRHHRGGSGLLGDVLGLGGRDDRRDDDCRPGRDDDRRGGDDRYRDDDNRGAGDRYRDDDDRRGDDRYRDDDRSDDDGSRSDSHSHNQRKHHKRHHSDDSWMD